MAKIHHAEARRRRPSTWIVFLTVTALCVLSYTLGSWQTTTTSSDTADAISKLHCTDTLPKPISKSSSPTADLDFTPHHTHELPNTTSTIHAYYYQPCPLQWSEYTPCQDPVRGRRFPREKLSYRERHCPQTDDDDVLRCLIPAPPNYKNPLKWPQSREFAWYDNIPHKELSIEKAVQNWVQVLGDKFRFPGGGTMFPHGADAYIDDIDRLLNFSDARVRTAIDTGCGVASWGAYLLKRNIIAMSIAPRDTHEAQVQFALERGVPAMIGIMSTERLPYPARAFDMAHCSRCLIPWSDYGGLYMIEVDRILRPGGYWILSGPPIRWKKHHKGWERSQEDLKQEQDSIEEIANRLSWKKLIEKDDLAIWQKPTNHSHFKKTPTTISICNSSDGDAAWYVKMEACITPLPEVIGGGEMLLKRWPERAFAIPPRIASGSIKGVSGKMFEDDGKLWKERVGNYRRMVPNIGDGRYRNVMDMNARFGGFAAAMVGFPVWVMNVVPITATTTTTTPAVDDTLGLIFERGFIGTYHDWCEAFSTYPRTYDLIHVSGAFSIYQHRCGMENILLEMDRILRPEGTVIFRDKVEIIVKIQEITQGMRWTSKIMDHETGPFNPEKILVAVKTYWTAPPAEMTTATARTTGDI